MPLTNELRAMRHLAFASRDRTSTGAVFGGISTMQTRIVGGLRLIVGLAALACAAGAQATTTVPLGSATGGVAIYFNNNGMFETATNAAYLRTQFSQTDVNGMQFNFDSTPLPGTGGLLSWYGIFQSVPNQFGLDLVSKIDSSDGTVATPVLHS